MKLYEYFILTGDDIKSEVRQELTREILDSVCDEYYDSLLEKFGSDPFDLGKPNATAIGEAVAVAVEKGFRKLRAEIELEITI